MSAIKLPVRAVYHWDRLEFVDADGQPVAPEDIAAALSAAPTQVFKGLSDVKLEDVLVQLTLAYNLGGVASLRAYLQAFAAPRTPQWQQITEEAVRGRGYLLLHPIARLKAQAPIVAEFERALNGEPQWIEEGGTTYSFDCFTHFMPLPAAPEAQGDQT